MFFAYNKEADANASKLQEIWAFSDIAERKRWLGEGVGQSRAAIATSTGLELVKFGEVRIFAGDSDRFKAMGVLARVKTLQEKKERANA